MRKGPIKVSLPADDEAPADAPHPMPAEVMELPDTAILNAGLAKFQEYAALHWPVAGKDAADFKLTSFDHRNSYHLRVTLGMVYLAMRKAEEES